MTPRELNLRNKLAKRATVDPEAFEVYLHFMEEGARLELRTRPGLDEDSMKRLDWAIQTSMDTPRFSLKFCFFYLCLGLFASTAIIQHTWWCTIFLALAAGSIPKGRSV